MTFIELQIKEKYLLSLLERLCLDIREYMAYPCPSIDIFQLKYQYDYELGYLKRIQQAMRVYDIKVNKPIVLNPEFEKWLNSSVI